MDAHKASYSITLMANVLEVTRAGYDAWKSRAAHRGQCTSARRCLDKVVAWEHEISRGTYGAPRIHRALQLGGVYVGGAGGRRHDAPPGQHGGDTHPPPGPARWARDCGS